MQKFEDAFQQPYKVGVQDAAARDAIVAWATADLLGQGLKKVANVVKVATAEITTQQDSDSRKIRFTLNHNDPAIGTYAFVAQKETGEPYVHWLILEGDEEEFVYTDDEFADALNKSPFVRANAPRRIGFRQDTTP